MNINLSPLLEAFVTLWLCYSVNNLKKDLKSKSNDLKDLKTDFNRLNDKIDKIDNDNKLNDKNLELLKKEISYHRESLEEIKKSKQETKDTLL
jgi:chromosome segregation ATPase